MDNCFIQAKTKDESLTQNEYYTSIGLQDFVDNNNHFRLNNDGDNALAKKIYRDNGSYKLMIKCDSYNKPCDPSNPLKTNKQTLSYKNGYKFMTVNNKAFDYYLKFLQTQNKSWLLNTERELI